MEKIFFFLFDVKIVVLSSGLFLVWFWLWFSFLPSLHPFLFFPIYHMFTLENCFKSTNYFLCSNCITLMFQLIFVKNFVLCFYCVSFIGVTWPSCLSWSLAFHYSSFLERLCVCVCMCVCISVCVRMYIIHFECHSFSMYIDQALQCSILGSKVEDIIMILLLCFVITLSIFTVIYTLILLTHYLLLKCQG